ncbi:WPP domain-interacting tail-anchored protein 1-like isoform X1 [Phoenix dactylifera]|uniref:WPP domain-interacting tail-anchored protein 1-like isoform X1 n=1 Tax=Phoenix dactylifera TaxID=42345 RepID=A0A8B7CEI9_PHODC|nr:WPP domain-interacting tail-anchored protein 1-like isoform X1 [Phoenix dactylifera]XP_038983381.1 WPP domain-interacting tail-anchored protein 1-like isoform X1 [Phoenix dactylifera]XP_038983385.1 WPP domain-interacting tail-anchored protein 1-like isoform X1 [Phoenix dactylifera]
MITIYKKMGHPTGERVSGDTAMAVLTRTELDLAYSSEKLLNLEILLMQVSSRARDFEALTTEYEDISNESIEKAFEFDALSGILNMEVKELDNFMASLQMEIMDAHPKLSWDDHLGESSIKIEEKLRDAEESIKQLQDLVADIRMQSAKFEGTLAFAHNETRTGGDEEMENGHFSSMNSKWKLQTVDQQRHLLQILEKSLAREMDLEKKLSDSRSNEEDLKLKLHYAERESYLMEETLEMILEKMFEAENAAELLLGIAKELIGKFQIVQLNLNGSLHRECEMRTKLQESMTKLSAEESALEKLKTSCAELDNILVVQENGLKASLKEADCKCMLVSSDVLTLIEKVRALEEQLSESDIQLQMAKASVEASQEQQTLLHSELSQLENVIEGLKENVWKTESRAESAEARRMQLTKTNMELNEKLGLLRNSGSEKAILLETKLKESNRQLEHAKASVEAMEQQQNMLYTALSDMEHINKELKGKVAKAESRAENAESKCTLLTETNLELNEELGYVRSRLECLETSLNQTDDAKVATAKDIGIRSKIITDLVMKLSLERECLQLQISALRKKNKVLAERCKTKDNAPITPSHKGSDDGNEFSILKQSEEALTESSTTNFQVGKPAVAIPVHDTGTDTTVSEEDSSGAECKIESVRTIEATQLTPVFLLMVFLVLLISVLTFYVYQRKNSDA